jgi:hypothetical protein
VSWPFRIKFLVLCWISEFHNIFVNGPIYRNNQDIHQVKLPPLYTVVLVYSASWCYPETGDFNPSHRSKKYSSLHGIFSKSKEHETIQRTTNSPFRLWLPT